MRPNGLAVSKSRPKVVLLFSDPGEVIRQIARISEELEIWGRPGQGD